MLSPCLLKVIPGTKTGFIRIFTEKETEARRDYVETVIEAEALTLKKTPFPGGKGWKGVWARVTAPAEVHSSRSSRSLRQQSCHVRPPGSRQEGSMLCPAVRGLAHELNGETSQTSRAKGMKKVFSSWAWVRGELVAIFTGAHLSIFQLLDTNRL